MTDSRENLIGRTLDGRYRIESLIARGGMATVYLANDLRLRRNVAVKVMHPALAEDRDFVHRFEREAHAAAQLTNPYVVAVHDQGQDAATGVIYLVMEHVEGRTVRDVLAERGALTEVQALAVLDPVLQALAAAHDAGFVHRDVKPENVLIADDGRVKVTDFGLARAITASPLSAATQGVLIGTVAYLSPEQVERGFADARSDVYGAGVLLFELLTGQVPHSGETPLAVAFQHVHNDVPAPSGIRASLSPYADLLVNRATQRAPELRFADARDFLAAVRDARSQLDSGYTAPAMPARHTAILPELQEAASTVVIERPTPAGRPKRRPLVLAIGLIAIAVIGGATWWFTIGTHTKVPSVVGMDVAAAERALRDASLTVTTDEQWDAEVPDGAVISEDPEAATTVKRGSSVHLVVSKGPERYEVPPLAGSTVSEARALLATLRFSVGKVAESYNETKPVGEILRSSPTAGTILRPGARVDLVVSKGPAPIAVPGVAGMAKADAVAALRNAGFVPQSSLAYSDSVAAGNVIATSPGTGALLQRGTTVRLSVSKGPAPVTVPDVFKMTRARATSTLEALGLKVAVKTSGKRLLNMVQDQSPKAGSVVAKGTTVTITIV